MLKSEPAFLNLKLRPDDTRRIVNQCQRAKWIAVFEYRGHGKLHQRWMVTPDGRAFAGLPHTPTSPHIDDAGCTDVGANGGCPTPPHMLGGTGDRARINEGANESKLVSQKPVAEDENFPSGALTSRSDIFF